MRRSSRSGFVGQVLVADGDSGQRAAGPVERASCTCGSASTTSVVGVLLARRAPRRGHRRRVAQQEDEPRVRPAGVQLAPPEHVRPGSSRPGSPCRSWSRARSRTRSQSRNCSLLAGQPECGHRVRAVPGSPARAVTPAEVQLVRCADLRMAVEHHPQQRRAGPHAGQQEDRRRDEPVADEHARFLVDRAPGVRAGADRPVARAVGSVGRARLRPPEASDDRNGAAETSSARPGRCDRSGPSGEITPRRYRSARGRQSAPWPPRAAQALSVGRRDRPVRAEFRRTRRGERPVDAAGVRLVAAAVQRRVAVRARRGARRRRQRVGRGDRVQPARHPQRAVRAFSSTRCCARPAGDVRPPHTLTIDESTAVGVAQRTDAARRLGFWLTGLTIYVGLEPDDPGRGARSDRPSGTRGPTVWTPRLPPPSSRCSGRACARWTRQSSPSRVRPSPLRWCRSCRSACRSSRRASPVCCSDCAPDVPGERGLDGSARSVRHRVRAEAQRLPRPAAAAVAPAARRGAHGASRRPARGARGGPDRHVGRHLELDARHRGGRAWRRLALWRRAPFIVVVVLGAATAALVRAAGWG